MPLLKSSSLLIAGAVLATAGCGAQSVPHPNVVPAAGVVTYKGAPVVGAAVILMSPETSKAGWICSGHTDRAGKFEITSNFAPGSQSRGIPVGDYTAVVTKFDEPSSGPRAHDAHPGASTPGSNPPPAASATKSEIPVKYATDQTSDLKLKIDNAGNGNLELKLAD
jgi:hypothetical protein